MGCVPLGWSGSGSAIGNHSDHGRSNEPMNPLWTRIHRFTWSIMIRVISDQWSWSGSSQRNAPMDSYCYFCTGVKVTCCTMRNTCLLSAPNSKSYLQLKQPLPRIFRYVELWFWMVHFCGWQRRRATRKWVFFRCLTLAGFYCSKVESLLSSNCGSGLPLDLLDWGVTF